MSKAEAKKSKEAEKQLKNTKKLFKKLLKSFGTPPELTVSQWADEYRRLSPESSAEAGRWNTDRAPYQRAIMDAVSDYRVEKIVLMTSAQIGKTEIMLNILGYHIDYDPAPILYIMPTGAMAGAFSKERLAPMIRDCPTLKAKVADEKSRTSSNTISNKQFAGGYIALIGANTPAELSSRPIRIVLADEVDRFPQSAGTEGDPLTLASKRQNTFWNKKTIEVSTPTIKGASKIEKEYESSSMEVLNIACPCCGEYQPYVWEQLKFDHEKGSRDFKLLGYECKHCGKISREVQWKKQPLKWIATHPERVKVRGFHLNELASPWRRWEDIVSDFLEAKRQGKQALQAWHNTSLGLTWEDDSDLDIADELLRRRAMYNCNIPKDVLVLTCGVDTQDNRLEYEIVGWGRNNVSYGIKYGVLFGDGDTGHDKVWEELDEVIFGKYEREDGISLHIATTCIDSGGHHTKKVYEYCKKRESRRVWAIKGQGGSGIPFIRIPQKRNQAGVFLFMIGVDVGKDMIASRLKTKFQTENGFCHFPVDPEAGYDEKYFDGLTAERRNVVERNGRIIINWVKKYEGIRNEPFDLRNYATAAYEICNPPIEKLYKLYNETGTQQEAKPKKKRKKTKKGIEIY